MERSALIRSGFDHEGHEEHEGGKAKSWNHFPLSNGRPLSVFLIPSCSSCSSWCSAESETGEFWVDYSFAALLFIS